MRKAIAALCCTLFIAASTPQPPHLPAHLAHKKLKLPAIAVSRMGDSLVIINLHAALSMPAGIFRLAAPHGGEVPTNLLLELPGNQLPWPGLAGMASGENSAGLLGAPPDAAGTAPPKGLPGEGDDRPDIGDAVAYEQLTLDKPCKTIAHCNWLGVRAIREGTPRRALRPFRTALQLATAQHDEYMKRIGYHNLAMAYWWMKHYRQAATWAVKGLGPALPAGPGRQQEASIADE